MSTNISYFKLLTEFDGGYVTFRNNGNDKIWGKGTVGNSFLRI